MRLPNCSKLVINWKNDNDIAICRHGVNVSFFDLAVFLLLYLVTGPSFMSISLLFLELWFSFIRYLPEIPKLEVPPSEFGPISGDWGESGIPYLALMFLIKSLLNAAKCQGYSFYRFWIIEGKPTGGGGGGEGEWGGITPTQIRL